MAQAAEAGLAVDGGGSGCRAAVFDRAGRVLGTGAGGAANVARDLPAAVASVLAAAADACRAAGLAPEALEDAPAWLGLAGAIDTETCARVAAALPWRRATVSEDRPTTMAGALAGADGCLVLAGTGSFLGRQAGGTQRFAGGWGAVLSDEASGTWLGRQVLARALAAHDGLRQPAPALDEALAAVGGPHAAALFSLRAAPAEFAALAPQVIAAAEAGDPAAAGLMRDGAAWIARGLRALEWQPDEVVCLAGGVGPRYARWLPEAMARRVRPPQGTPLDGAVRLAREAAGWA